MIFHFRSALLFLALVLNPGATKAANPFATYNEPGFPFFGQVADARHLGPPFPADNLTVRGLVFTLSDDAYAVFDTDLLRWSVAWTGDFVEMNSIATLSYQTPRKKAGGGQKKLPRILGAPHFANGLYPGGSLRQPILEDPRPPCPDPREPGRGPIPSSLGQWLGVYTMGPQAVLSYRIGGVPILDRMESLPRKANTPGFRRTLHIGPHHETLYFNLASIDEGMVQLEKPHLLKIRDPEGLTTIFKIRHPEARLETHLHYICLVIKPGPEEQELAVEYRRSDPRDNDRFAREPMAPAIRLDPLEGGPAHWPETISATGSLAKENNASYVIDDLPLPLPNPWRRDVRFCDIDFFPDGRAALVTLDGDVWILSGITERLETLQWRRIASGIHEPQSLCLREGEIFVFSKNGVERLVDLNGDGEIDFYSNFCSAFGQTAETREFPMDMVLKPDGGFYLAKGGQVQTHHGHHNGTIIEVSADGSSASVFARGLRQAYLGIDPGTGRLVASDNQGHFIPATPFHILEKGAYYGFDEAERHPENLPSVTPPATWIPHPVNQSGAGHEWIRTDRLGNLENHFLRFGFHQGSLYKVFIDEETTPRQAGIVQLDLLTGLPLLKGAQNPIDGQVYLTGMQVWGSRSTLTSGLRRLRYTGKPSVLPTEARIFRQGILLRFEQTLPSSTMTDLSRYVVQRWNYLRSPKYGSSHYRLNGQTGQDPVALSQIEVSHDGKALFAVAPDMQPSHQLSFDYRLEDTSGRPMRNTAYFTAHTLPEFEPAKAGFPPFTIGEAAYPTLAAAPGPVSIEEGKSLSLRLGCLGCHSTDGSMVGMKGPGWKGLYQSDRLLTNGKTVVATPDYLRESILNPTAKTARGFDTGETGMPPYEGILKEEQLQSIILYLKSLR